VTSVEAYYARQDALTDPGPLRALYDDLPADPAALRTLVSSLIAHVSWAAQYGIPPDAPMPRETQAVADRLRAIQSAFAGSLQGPRPVDKRTFGTCRDYALLFCSMLRQRAIPARVRCGFANYFKPGPYEDHWVCEYWLVDEVRWARADAQLDALHREQLNITFDCADMPKGAFLTAGEAWRLVRSGAAVSGDFGHDVARGLWFLRVNLHRDGLAMVNRQTSAWDSWRNATAQNKQLGDAELRACDVLAEALLAAQSSAVTLPALRALAEASDSPPWPT
jgi:hypothetical protein